MMALPLTVYVTMLVLFAEPGRNRLWPTWWLLIPALFFAVAAFLTFVPLKSPVAPPVVGRRVGIEIEGGKGRVLRPRIRKMDTGISARESDYDIQDPDIS